MATYDFNSGKSKIMELINEASLLLKGVPDVLAATRTEDRGKLATWASDYVRNGALQMYYPVLSGKSNVILAGNNTRNRLANLRDQPPQRQFRFNPDAEDFVMPTTPGGKRRKNRSSKKYRGGDNNMGNVIPGYEGTNSAPGSSLISQNEENEQKRILGNNLLAAMNGTNGTENNGTGNGNYNPNNTAPSGGRRRRVSRKRRVNRKNRSARKNRSSRKVRSARRCMSRKSSRRANRK